MVRTEPNTVDTSCIRGAVPRVLIVAQEGATIILTPDNPNGSTSIGYLLLTESILELNSCLTSLHPVLLSFEVEQVRHNLDLEVVNLDLTTENNQRLKLWIDYTCVRRV